MNDQDETEVTPNSDIDFKEVRHLIRIVNTQLRSAHYWRESAPKQAEEAILVARAANLELAEQCFFSVDLIPQKKPLSHR